MDSLWWETFDSAWELRSLQKLTLSEGFEVNRHGIGALRVGIDGGGWLTETLPAIGSGENARLERLFYKLCQLLQVHTTVVFVFSGPNGPDFKRGEAVNKTPHPLTSQFQLLIQAFGFHCHTAPGDAEPELACLNRQGLIDVIFTHNPNIFILGATHIADEDNDFKNAHIFTADAVNQSAKLSTGGLLLIAILTGGDYALGLPGCDDTLAISLAQCGLGNSLLLAAQTLGPADLGFFLTVWCNTLKTTLISQGYPATAAQVTEAFPDPHILSLYVKPLTSWSFNGPGVDASDWRVNVPNLISIVRMCEDLFEWGTPAELPNKLFVVLLPGLCMKPRDELRLLQAHFEDRGDEAIPPLSSFIWINRPHGEVYQVEISTRTIATVITSSLRGTRHNRPTPVQPPKTIVHVGIPRSLLLHGLPAMVNRYESQTAKKVRLGSGTDYSPILAVIGIDVWGTTYLSKARSLRLGHNVYPGALLDALRLLSQRFRIQIMDSGINPYLGALTEFVVGEIDDGDKENREHTVDD